MVACNVFILSGGRTNHQQVGGAVLAIAFQGPNKDQVGSGFTFLNLFLFYKVLNNFGKIRGFKAFCASVLNTIKKNSEEEILKVKFRPKLSSIEGSLKLNV